MDFGVLPHLFNVGDEYIKELEVIRSDAKEERQVRKRKLAVESLRERDPW